MNEERKKIINDLLRKKLWIWVAIVLARSENCRDSGIPAKRANKVLNDYGERFGR